MKNVNLLKYRKQREMSVFRNTVFWIIVAIIVAAVVAVGIVCFQFMMLPIGQWPAWAVFLVGAVIVLFLG